jgi:hypothetical protein
MKNILVFSFIMLFSTSLFSQEDDALKANANPTSEIKLNALFMVLGAFDITYEYLLNQESGLGLEVFIPFDDELSDDIDYYISPYYRMYFGEKYASGFFLEGFGMLNASTVNEIIFFDNQGNITRTEVEKETNFALGIGIGGKWYTKSGFIGELSLGIGRNLISSDYNNEIVGKVGITVGYRF